MDNSSSGELIGVAMSTHTHVKEAAEELIKRGLRAEGTKYREFDVYGSRFMGLLAISQNQKRLKEIVAPMLAEFYDLTFIFWQLSCDDLISKVKASLDRYQAVEQNRAKFLTLKNAPPKEHYANAVSDQERKLTSQKQTPSKPINVLAGDDWSMALTGIKNIFGDLFRLENEVDGWLITAESKIAEAKKSRRDRVLFWLAIVSAMFGGGILRELIELAIKIYNYGAVLH